MRAGTHIHTMMRAGTHIHTIMRPGTHIHTGMRPGTHMHTREAGYAHLCTDGCCGKSEPASYLIKFLVLGKFMSINACASCHNKSVAAHLCTDKPLEHSYHFVHSA